MTNLSSNLQGGLKDKQKKEEWRLFNAKDFQTLMYPCFTMCRILGIFSYEIKASTFEVSKLYCILSIVIICVYNIFAVIIIYNIANLKFDLKNFLVICIKGSTILLGDFIMMITLILTGPRTRLLQTILKISSRLPSKSYQKLSRLVHAKDIIRPLLIVLMSIATIPMIEKTFLFQFYVNLMVFQMDMLYMNCVCILKACFKEINDNLVNMREFIVTNNKPRVPRLIYHEQRNPFLMVMELKALKKQHLRISDTVQMLNTIFSLQLFATVVMSFSYITVNLYTFLLGWYNLLPGNISMNVSLQAIVLSHVAQFFMKIVLMGWVCETGKDEVQQISTSIHDMFNSTTNEQIKNELQLFSLQVLHCNNTFSGKGFTMDAKLLAGIISSIITYLMIMFQFRSVSCKEKSTINSTEVI